MAVWRMGDKTLGLSLLAEGALAGGTFPARCVLRRPQLLCDWTIYSLSRLCIGWTWRLSSGFEFVPERDFWQAMVYMGHPCGGTG
jgi:hypothetical protein